MEFRDKEESVLEFIRLGMDFVKACLASGLTEEEQEFLEDDESFQRKLLVEDACFEKTLLERHETASILAEKKGSTHAIEWKLAKLNPSRFGNKETNGDGMFTGKLVVNMIRGSKEEDSKE